MAADLPEVLIIDDSLTDSLLLGHLIQKQRIAHTHVITDGLDGLAYCLKTPPDLILLDLNLPRLGGEEICRLLRGNDATRRIPIIIISEIPDAHRREFDLLGMGANRYFRKPFDPEPLLEAVRSLLGESPTGEGIARGRFDSDALIDVRSLTLETPPTARHATDAPTTRGSALQAEPEVETSGSSTALMYPGYRILEIIGTGGMGTVYKAEQLSIGRRVALKVVLDHGLGTQKALERFQAEARIMGQFSHSNIVQIYDMGLTNFTAYIAMELVDGHNLTTLLEKEALTWDDRITIVRGSSSAVAYLHQHGVIHRDIKPSNILFSRERRVKLTDFGVSFAKSSSDSIRPELSKVLGTQSFMAPELLRGQMASELTDQFALGMTYWRLFAGRAGTGQPGSRPLSEVRRDLPARLSLAVERMYHPNPAARFPSILVARNAILEALGEDD